MNTYYKDDFLTLYLGDCRELIPRLELTADSKDSIDVILSDPPYGMQYNSGHYKYGNPFKPIEQDDRYPTDLLPKFREISSKAVLLFARWETLKEIDEPDSVIVWVKNNWTAGDLNHEYARQWEAILFYKGPNHKFYNGRPSDVIYCDRVPPTTHPTEKPEPLISKLILQNTDVGDTIFDPYLGSGTTAFCAKKLQRKCIGAEIDERYLELAARRCSQQSMDLGA